MFNKCKTLFLMPSVLKIIWDFALYLKCYETLYEMNKFL